MGNMFAKPKVAEAPAPTPVTPMPVRDDEAERKAKMDSYAKQAQRGGRDSTRLTSSETRLGDSSMATTRSSSTLGSV